MSLLTARVEVCYGRRQPVPLLLGRGALCIDNGRLAAEQLANLVGHVPEGSLAEIVQMVLVDARAIQAAQFLEEGLVVGVRCEGRRCGEVRRRVLGEDLLQQPSVLQSNLLEVAERSFVGWDGVRLEPSAVYERVVSALLRENSGWDSLAKS